MQTINHSFNKIIALLIALVTLFAAIIGFLQGDAAARDDRANRDSKQYALQAFGREVSGHARFNFDTHVVNLANRFSLQSLAAANREDNAAALRYEKLAKEITQFSPLLNQPYAKFNPDGTFTIDDLRYETESYLVETTILREKFLAASNVKEAWDYKANTYIKHITLLAIALFLFGLSTTLSQGATRWIFAISGIAFTIVAVGWALSTVLMPVFDLRTQGNAIQDYADGVGFSHQGKHKEALSSFNKALEAFPTYINALVARAETKSAMEDYAAAAKDYETAIQLGDSRAYVLGDLAWVYFLLGRFDDSIQSSQKALQKSPDELWIQFQLALCYLVKGDFAQAKELYDKGMESATKQVAEAKQAGKEPPSYLWWSLEDGASSLEFITQHIESPQKNPPISKIAKPQQVQEKAIEIIYKIKSLAVALEYNGKPSEPTKAKISPFWFAEPNFNDDGEVESYQEPKDTFSFGVNEIGVMFDYENMKDGMDTIMRVFVDGEEDPSWRLIDKWQLGEKGNAVIPLSYAYSDTYTFAEGEYLVEFYVDYQLVQQGTFWIKK